MGNLWVPAKDELDPIIDMEEMLMFAPIIDFPLYEALYTGLRKKKITKWGTDAATISCHVFQDIAMKFGMPLCMGNLWAVAKDELNPVIIKEVMLAPAHVALWWALW
jgi:hypothetical protein